MEALIRLKALLSDFSHDLSIEEEIFVKEHKISLPAANEKPEDEGWGATILNRLGRTSPAIRSDFAIARGIAQSPFINVDGPTPRVSFCHQLRSCLRQALPAPPQTQSM